MALNIITPYLNTECDVCVFIMWYGFKGRASLIHILRCFVYPDILMWESLCI